MLAEEKELLEETTEAYENKKKHVANLRASLKEVNETVARQITLEDEEAAQMKQDRLDRIAQSAKDLTADFEMQAKVFGMSSRAAAIFKLEMEGATRQQLESARAASAVIEGLEKEKAALEESKRIKDIGTDYLKRLREEYYALGLSSDAAELLRLKNEGVSESQLKRIKRLQEFTARRKESIALDRDAKALMERYKAPIDKFTEAQARLNKMRKQGAIDDRTYKMALEDAKDSLKDAERQVKKDYTVRFSATGVEALEAGTAEAIARLMEFRANARADANIGIDDVPAKGKVAGLSPKAQAQINTNSRRGVKNVIGSALVKDQHAAVLAQIATNTRKTAETPAVELKEATF